MKWWLGRELVYLIQIKTRLELILIVQTYVLLGGKQLNYNNLTHSKYIV